MALLLDPCCLCKKLSKLVLVFICISIIIVISLAIILCFIFIPTINNLNTSNETNLNKRSLNNQEYQVINCNITALIDFKYFNASYVYFVLVNYKFDQQDKSYYIFLEKENLNKTEAICEYYRTYPEKLSNLIK